MQNSLTEELSVKSKNHSRWQWAFGTFGAYQWLKTDAPVYIDGDMNKYLSRRITAIAYNGVLAAMTKRIAADMIKKGVPEDKAMQVAAIAAKAAIAKAGGIKINMQMQPIFRAFPHTNFQYGFLPRKQILTLPAACVQRLACATTTRTWQSTTRHLPACLWTKM